MQVSRNDQTIAPAHVQHLNRVQSNSTYDGRKPSNKSYTSSSSSSKQKPTTPAPVSDVLPSERKLLESLAAVAKPTLSQRNFGQLVQAVKGALYDKDYDRAFGSDEFRFAYAARWVPSRAVIYHKILREHARHVTQAFSRQSQDSQGATDDDSLRTQGHAVMIGGGAGSEVAALTSWLAEAFEADNDATTSNSLCSLESVRIQPIDTSDWSAVLRAQHARLVSAYPSPSNRVQLDFTQADVLDSSSNRPAPESTFATANLVTILFTISELFLQSRPRTLALLDDISSHARPGTLLLVVESAALATIPVGSSGRSYPLGMLLDGALATDRGRNTNERARWDTLATEDAKWYRMPRGADECYPGQQLENSRVVLRLYRRL